MKTYAYPMLAALLAAPAAVTPASAAVVLDGGGKVTGITGLALGSAIYDVTFRSGTFTSVFGTTLDFTSTTAAAAARGALNAALNAVSNPAPFLAPADPIDNRDTLGNSFYVPYELSGRTASGVAATYAGLYVTVGGAVIFPPGAEPAVWADFMLVPLPGTALLLGSALAGLGWFARRQRQAA